MAKKGEIDRGDRVRIVKLRQEPEGEPVPEDVVGKEGVVQWVTPGFSGERGVFEVELDDGRVLNFYAPEIEPVG